MEVVGDLLRSCKVPCKEMIRNLIAIEISYINTNHPDFIGGGDAITKILQRRAQRQLGAQGVSNPLAVFANSTLLTLKKAPQQLPPVPSNVPPEYQQQYQKEMEAQFQRDQKAREREELARQARAREQREREAKKVKEKKFVY